MQLKQLQTGIGRKRVGAAQLEGHRHITAGHFEHLLVDLSSDRSAQST